MDDFWKETFFALNGALIMLLIIVATEMAIR
jgi:hypothetical protein